MKSTATRTLIRKLGNSVKGVARNKSSCWWYTPHMAAASRAIADRIPLVDFVIEVRDARIPLSSKFYNSEDRLSSSRHILVLNKADLADRSVIKEWITYFAKQNTKCFGVNAHNKDSVKELLNFLQTRVKDIIKDTNSRHTKMIMLVGIPNVGKSALANSLHQIGRISATEKGKLKHAIISPHPGETKNIISLKIASHPNIYILDTPGILPPEIFDEEVCSKLALSGAIQDCITGKTIIAQCFLAILNLSDEYKKWEKFYASPKTIPKIEHLDNYDVVTQQKRHHLSDHTQDMAVNEVRRVLYEAISCFRGNLGNEKEMMKLVELEFNLLQKAFGVSATFCDEESNEDDVGIIVATKLLDLYRIGRLGHYILDPLPIVSTN